MVLGKGSWIPRKMRCQQLHESAQGWSSWASWTTEPWLKIGNQQSQDLQLNDHTRLSCLQRKGDCLIHLHNPAHTPAPTNTSESLVRALHLVGLLLVHLVPNSLSHSSVLSRLVCLQRGKYYTSESNNSPSKGLQVGNENRRWISNEGNMEFHLHT